MKIFFLKLPRIYVRLREKIICYANKYKFAQHQRTKTICSYIMISAFKLFIIFNPNIKKTRTHAKHFGQFSTFLCESVHALHYNTLHQIVLLSYIIYVLRLMLFINKEKFNFTARHKAL